MSNLPSGNANEEKEVLNTSSSTSSSSTTPASSEVASYLATLGTGKAEEALSWKPSSTVLSSTPDELALGALEYRIPVKGSGQISPKLQRSYSAAPPSVKLQRRNLRHSSSIIEELSGSQRSKRDRDFDLYGASSSAGHQGQAKLPRSTKRLATPTFTVWQAKSLSGSTGMTATVFSSLTTLRARLGAKYSYDTWKAIRSCFQSREDFAALSTVLSAFARTTGMSTSGRLRSAGALILEDSSGSSESEESMESSSSSCEEEDSDQEDSIDLTHEDEPCSRPSKQRSRLDKFDLDTDY